MIACWDPIRPAPLARHCPAPPSGCGLIQLQFPLRFPPLNEDFDKAFKKVFGLFLLTLFAYVTVFGACQAYRRRNGAWTITFDRSQDGTPVLRIEQPKLLAAGAVSLSFPGETVTRNDLPITAVFNYPITNAMPFGPVIFVDTSQLPGDVTLNVFGHAVEIFPRTLRLDLREISWSPGTNIVVTAGTKPSAERMTPHDQQWKGR